MHGAAAARGFPFSEPAPFEPSGGIFGQRGAAETKRMISLLATAIEGNHGFDGLLFLFVVSVHAGVGTGKLILRLRRPSLLLS